MRPRRADRFLAGLSGAILLGAALAVGCATSGSIKAAEAGDIEALRRALAADLGAGELDVDDARGVARAVAAFEIERARGAAGVDRIRELAACARELDGALARRADRDGRDDDESGAAAALARIDARLADAGDDAREALGRTGPPRSQAAAAAWRVVEARSLSGPGDGAERRRRFTDGDQEVRTAALRAAADAADPADTEALLEAARLDPHPLARTIAVRAAGAIGGERVVLALKDLWAGADEALRHAIADAWGAAASIDVGGRRELLWAIDAQPGAPAIAAAHALSRLGGAGRADAIGVLARAIASGVPRDRVYAIAVAPLGEAPLRDAVIKAESDDDDVVALAALARRLETPAAAGGAPDGSVERKTAVKKLLAAAEGTSSSALSARGALARAGAREVVPKLTRDMGSPDERVRRAAATGLAELGELPRAALLVADATPSVRTAAACAILSSR